MIVLIAVGILKNNNIDNSFESNALYELDKDDDKSNSVINDLAESVAKTNDHSLKSINAI
jgi:hypothetical protein